MPLAKKFIYDKNYVQFHPGQRGSGGMTFTSPLLKEFSSPKQKNISLANTGCLQCENSIANSRPPGSEAIRAHINGKYPHILQINPHASFEEILPLPADSITYVLYMKNTFRFGRALVGLALFFFTAFHTSGTTYYASTTGSSSASGTVAAPLTFAAAIAKSLVAGDSVILRGGTYSFTSTQRLSKSGSSTKNIYYGAYPGETPILDFRGQAYNSSNQGVLISGNYIHFKGITVQGAGDNGIQVTGSNNKIEYCVARWNCDSGFQMKTGSDNLVLNCDSYENFDYQSVNTDGTPNYGGNADGFADKQYTNTGTNTYRSCRSWLNADDGWDSYQKIGNTVYDSCWCYANGPASFDMKTNIRFKTDSASWFYKFASTNFVMTNYGNGNGFKLGGAYTAHNTLLKRCVSVLNTVKGFDQNNNAGTMTVYNCSGYMNKPDYGFSNSTYGTLVIRNCASLATKSSNSLSASSVTQSNNSWNSGFSCATSDFLSVDYTQLLNARQADGSLPVVSFLNQKATSNLINKGVNVGYWFAGSAPDLGAFEFLPTTGLEAAGAAMQLRIYPNPVAEKAILSFEADCTETLVITISDMTGRTVLQYNIAASPGNNKAELTMSALPKGNYICRISGNSIHASIKLIK